MTMLEKAAIAANCEEASEWEEYTEYAKEAARRCMRDALRSIREPDEEVIEAMAAALVRPTLLMGTSSALARRQVLAIWQAGIDAMMEDGK